MNALVLYATRTGNTQHVAAAIASALRPYGRATLLPVERAGADDLLGVNLLIVGGPTEAHGATEAVTHFFESLPSGALRGIDAAAFDTRVNWPRFLSGSAALKIRDRLRAAGAHMVCEPQSFLVSSKPLLLEGELQRAEAWAASIVRQEVAASSA